MTKETYIEWLEDAIGELKDARICIISAQKYGDDHSILERMDEDIRELVDKLKELIE